MLELKQYLHNFLDTQGRLIAFPARRKMKIYALLYLAQTFEVEKSYSEQEINEILLQRHTFSDPITLRRWLVDYRFLERSRDGSVYCMDEKQPTIEEIGL